MQSDMCPIHEAAVQDQKEVLSHLLASKAEVDSLDAVSMTQFIFILTCLL